MIEKYDPKKIEKEAQKLWEEQKIADKIVDFKKNLAERGKSSTCWTGLLMLTVWHMSDM